MLCFSEIFKVVKMDLAHITAQPELIMIMSRALVAPLQRSSRTKTAHLNRTRFCCHINLISSS